MERDTALEQKIRGGKAIERRYKVDKIVIRTNSPESVRSMASCLRTLFPECEIIVQSGHGEIGEDVQKVSARPIEFFRMEN